MEAKVFLFRKEPPQSAPSLVRPNRAGDDQAVPADRYRFRAPEVEDGAAIWSLVKESESLELNSPYSYLLSAAYFAETSVIAEQDGRLAGFAWAFLSPPRPQSLFVWQIGVASATRGEGVGKELLKRLLARPACRGVRYLEATVTPSNTASAALFRALARELDAPCAVTPAFPSELFPGGAHEPEDLFRIGPIPRSIEQNGQTTGDKI